MAKHLRPESPGALTPRPQTLGSQEVEKEVQFPERKVLRNMAGEFDEVRQPYLAWDVRKLLRGPRTPKLSGEHRSQRREQLSFQEPSEEESS